MARSLAGLEVPQQPANVQRDKEVNMPGPMSTPMFWEGNSHRNKSGNHGLQARGPRISGKTKYDQLSGKSARHAQNLDAGREWNRSGGGYRTHA